MAVFGAGLTELNLSTGDDHQAFVPFDRVVTAAITAAELGICTLIVVEG
ncbi:MAG: radical SAM protein, partial [Sulfobacillus benefaciens]